MTATKTRYTPGPLYARGTEVRKDYGDRSYTIAECGDQDEAHADARLFAAAPDLLATLRQIANSHLYCKTRGMGLHCDFCQAVDVARAVIAKAEGGGK